jgi:hypothetical protein
VQLERDRRLELEFHGSSATSASDLLAYRDLDAALSLLGTSQSACTFLIVLFHVKKAPPDFRKRKHH